MLRIYNDLKLVKSHTPTLDNSLRKLTWHFFSNITDLALDNSLTLLTCHWTTPTHN
ncbi:hypothetical protein DPMN_059043 [Dreissena polymorpha]|uniref:Uncharacterized protein n=1 Tax=Dreissena polymorpha TaxID=45954 RepID=A0A9D4C2U8_DREPO|nr:hypothetical protein DPMN_059043 [Dreissena polymorpha]